MMWFLVLSFLLDHHSDAKQMTKNRLIMTDEKALPTVATQMLHKHTSVETWI